LAAPQHEEDDPHREEARSAVSKGEAPVLPSTMKRGAGMRRLFSFAPAG
jgi:hypothetical protein